MAGLLLLILIMVLTCKDVNSIESIHSEPQEDVEATKCCGRSKKKVSIHQAFFVRFQKNKPKKLSFLKKLRPKNEKKLKTEAKKLRSLEALCNDLSQKTQSTGGPI